MLTILGVFLFFCVIVAASAFLTKDVWSLFQ